VKGGLRESFVLRRMGATRLLLGSVLLAVLVTAALTGALASFSARSLPAAVHRQLSSASGIWIDVSGQIDRAQATTDSAAVRSSTRAAFGDIPLTIEDALWSDSLALPGPPNARITRLVQAAAPDRIRAHAALVSGQWPGQPHRGAPVPAAIPALTAKLLGAAPGDVLALHDSSTGSAVRLRLTGVFRPLRASSPYWGLSLLGTSGSSVRGDFVTYGPLIVSPAAFSSGILAVGDASWVAVPDPASIPPGDLGGLAGRIDAASNYLAATPKFGGLDVTSTLPQLLRGVASNLEVARSLLLIGALQLLLLTAAAVALAARLLATQREEESALLSARGMARWQLAVRGGAEAVLIVAVPAVAGALLGARLAASAVSASAAAETRQQAAAIPGAAWWSAAAILLLCTVIMLWPVVRPPAPGSARVRQGRQVSLAGAVRVGADAALVGLAVVAFWQLRTYSAVQHRSTGGLGIDPVLAVAPTVALAGAALIPLRLLPAIARGLDTVTGRTRRLGAAMAAWQVSRHPVRQSGPVLLVVLAVATGTIALAQHQSWRRSAEDRAAFSAGADIRVDLPAPVPLGKAAAVAHARGVLSAMPVARFGFSGGGEVLALDARQAAATALLRPDLSALPVTALWRRVTPAGRPPGLPLPGHPQRLAITASLALAAGAPSPGPMSASVSVQDADGVVYSVPAGTLTAGRQRLIASLSAEPLASYPLRLLGLTLTYTLPIKPTPGDLTVTIGGLAVSAAAAGQFPAPFTDGGALRRWTRDVASVELATGNSIPPVPPSAQPSLLPSPHVKADSQALTFQPGYGALRPFSTRRPHSRPLLLRVQGALTLRTPLLARNIPAVATRAFLRAAQLKVGDTASVAVGADTVGARIVAAVSQFPTVAAGQGGALIVDQAALQDALVAESDPPVPVTQWWLRTAGPAAPFGLPAGAVVTSRAKITAALLADPVAAAPQRALLAISVAAALLAALGFSVSVAASMRQRRTQNALLAALGVDRLARARQLCLEQLMLSLPAAVMGLLVGAGLAWLLIPAVTLTASASAPVPPVLVEIPLGWTAGLALAVTAIPVLAAAATVAYRPDPAAQLRAAEAT
jgi:hypothetical protein